MVIVAEKSKPPVCRIMDHGKLVYEQKKKKREQKKHTHAQKVKEIKFKLRIEKHDYEYKINHAISFLEKSDKVKATIIFRGRELSHKELGFELINRIVLDLEDHAKIDSKPNLAGKNITATFLPLSKKKGNR